MKFFLAMLLLIKVLNGYELFDNYLGCYGVNKGNAGCEIESSFDFEGCLMSINIHKINKPKFDFKSCRIINDSHNNSLVCTKDLKRCVKKVHISRILIDNLNGIGSWRVSGVARDDTLSVRKGAESKYRKVYALLHNARNLKVLSVANNGSTT